MKGETRRSGRAGLGLGVSILLAFLLLPGAAFAGSTGRLTGRVLDEQKKPVEGVNVAIPAARTGALTDADGRYTITNIPAGTYEVRMTLLGYGPTLIRGVEVHADNTTRLDAALTQAPVAMQEVVITAKRPVVDPNQTSNVAIMSRQEIAKLPVQELQELVGLQAGVVSSGGELHFRGGRAGEVQFQVDGISVNNSFDNKSTLRLDRSLLEEVQVISGTFDAEYGQAMSGVVNAVLRRGGEKFEWNGEAMLGSWMAPRGAQRIEEPRARPGDVQNFQLSVSGPTHVPKTTFLMNVRRGDNEDWVSGERLLMPVLGLGDDKSAPLGYTREWSGVFKVTNRRFSNLELGYQAVGNWVDAQSSAWVWRYDPDGRTKQRTRSIAHGADATLTLSKSSFANLIVRQNYFDYRDMAYENFYDPRYDAAGPPRSDSNFLRGSANYAGVDLGRFTQNTNALLLKTSYTNESSQLNHVKVGGEFQWPLIRFGHPGAFLVGTNGTSLVRKDEILPGAPAVREYSPLLGAAFAQDEVEWEELRVRGGFRVDYFNARSTLPSDLANPANSITGAPDSPLVPVSAKVSVSPRLGVSYPVAKGTSLYFAYGHFYQLPPLRDIFQNADYSTLKDLQARVEYSALGNPDVKPERTVQYQFGFKQAINENLGLDIVAFYKDVRDLLGTEFVSTYNDAEYARITNVDFGSIIGVTVSLDQRALGPLSLTTDYTWQVAKGNESDPRETATRASANEDALPHQQPFDWDQRHTLNVTATVAEPDRYSWSAVLRVVSGQPYTPSTSVGGFGNGLEKNGGRKPFSWLVDLRGETPLQLYGLRMNGFARIFNLFDARFFNGSVFESSGNAFESTSASDVNALGDPTRFYPPRRFEFGISMRGGS